MVWLEDPLTGDAPHRTIVEEVDEQQAQELAPEYTAQPEVQWYPDIATVTEPIVVFLVGQAASLLAGTFLQGGQAVGSIAVPQLVRVKSPLEEEYGSGQRPMHTSTLSALAADGAAPPLLLVRCPRELPAEQAAAWTQGVLGALRPCGAVVATTLPAMAYRGPGSPADDDLVFSLHTAALRAGGGALPPPLPGATLLGGLPAALLAACELRLLPAVLVAGVQLQQVADAQLLLSLGGATQAALRVVGGEAVEQAAVQRLPRAQLLAALAAGADGVYRSSASSSIFS